MGSTKNFPGCCRDLGGIEVSGAPKILLMDDEEGIRDVAGKIFRYLNCDVEMAADGEEMVERFLKAHESGRSFDLLILDLSVPRGMGGLETMKVLQEIDPDVAAVLSTGFSDDSKVGDLRQLGFFGVLPKPYRIDDIRELLEELVPGYTC